MRIWNRIRVERPMAATTAAAVLVMVAMTLPACSQFTDFLFGHEDLTGVEADLASLGYLRKGLPDRPYVNAERAAVFYSGELYAPEELYQTLASDARQAAPYLPYATSEDGVNTAACGPVLREPWVVGTISLRADTATYEAMRAGSYHDWDRLNEAVGVYGITYGTRRPGGTAWVSLGFSRRLHTQRVARMYGTLPGIRGTETQPWSTDYGEGFVHFEPQSRTYYHRLGSGICTDTCTSYVWTVIRVDGDGARVLDTWEGEPPEAWAAEIEVARAEYAARAEAWE